MAAKSVLLFCHLGRQQSTGGWVTKSTKSAVASPVDWGYISLGWNATFSIGKIAAWLEHRKECAVEQENSPPDCLVAEIVEPTVSPTPEPKPWGFWTTLLFSVITFVALLAIEVAVIIGCIVVIQVVEPARQGDLARNIKNYYGLLMSIAGLSSMPLCFGLILLWVRLRGQLSICDYLAIHRRPLKHFLLGAVALAVLLWLQVGTSYLFEHHMSSIMVDAYRTAVIVPLFWALLIIAAPVFEETLFRGFLFRGIQQTWMGNIGATLITSLLWASMHLQYGLYEIAWIFAVGLLLGCVRAKSNSIVPTIFLHAAMNLVAAIELQLLS